MKHNFLKPLLLALTIGFFFASCSSDDDGGVTPELPQGDFDLGYIIANEGNFGSPNASVSFIDADLMTVENSIFEAVNPSENLGDVLNHIAFGDENAFLVMNNSNKIVVVNRFSFEYVTTLTESIALPRYAVVENGKLFVSNSQSQDIAVYDTSDFSFITSIAIDKPVELLKADAGKLFVQNASFGTGNEITVINTDTNEITSTLTVDGVLNSIDDEDGILYALHSEGISKFNTSTASLIETINFSGEVNNPSKLNIEDDKIFFITGSQVYASDLNATEIGVTPLFDTEVEGNSFTVGYGFSVENGNIFYSDVNGFTADSELLIYDYSGNLVQTLTTGVGTNAVYFND
ncbi:YncE family protein [Psychroflexus halocasei]|uniref:40-residue YVTN family beta-propeller repeat-containing protein n=1 Tax=Psychroflexus halocasei TaxID=908615 RepID=A0A1H3YWK8_9FLAO|nr:DUF5074 domain-containing protein [Psychroflexus halocasei]SEA15478.1 hypothetical protein SAMN05421540_103271 [Psychroflexus halocasei]